MFGVLTADLLPNLICIRLCSPIQVERLSLCLHNIMPVVHVAAYLCFCAVTVAFMVFLNSTQPFVISQIFGQVRQGATSSVLALADESVAIIAAPLWGALSDKIGTRYVAVMGLSLVSVALMWYPRSASVYPGLLCGRIVFALGVAACVSMMTAILGETSQVGLPLQYFDHMPLLEPPADDQQMDEPAVASRSNGKLSGMVGFASGLGAVFAVAVLLPLPTRLGYEEHASEALRRAFSIVGGFGLLTSLILFWTLYQSPVKGLSVLFGNAEISIFDEAALDAGGPMISYIELLRAGFGAAKEDFRLQVSYFGSLVARAATVVLALFVPLVVNDWYYKTGRCEVGDKAGCRDGVIRAAILTGVANTVALLFAPIVGWSSDRLGPTRVIICSSLVGMISMVGLFNLTEVESITAIALCSLLGVAQIGTLTVSMSMATDKRREHNGSVAGVYSLFGSAGILLVTQIGGVLADTWVKSPFAVLGVLFLVLLFMGHRLIAGSRYPMIHA